ncbi:gliding motility lipoprotein GldH [Marivirga tractuosa]|uniref:Gliding motility-associated lipoprotein GldH n=1 Tax=Marivirga tractuosa (strain ATCC 23168 / DSM 4126 / NBRC 15989 / NCIMB 1408 / VKM B-1430 / H-43) TaxID=643867 RepID=E4TL41_MARTH|nr:gliding motility lipoprotein GldH [Marivirga tractuosa]ADR23318.1 gliding motility-associated lipoprotein GldH [Marivirga tractuosa DSM 4126]BDD16008.1 gliding motility lipoprotein GldH [Marivirga tractuosa]
MRAIYSTVFMAFLIFACTEERYYENNHDFKDRIWNMEESAVFNFEIDSIEIPYQIKLNVRNTMEYPYRNLYINYQLRDSTNLMEDKLVNLKLFEAKTGKPYGDHQSDLYSHQLILQDSVFFHQKGKYKIELKQYMREMELEGIVSTGIRIEQIKN